MGLLRSSDCLDWDTIVKLKEELKKRGVMQFVDVYKNAHSTFMHEFIWGDEIEIMACVRIESSDLKNKNLDKNLLVLGEDNFKIKNQENDSQIANFLIGNKINQENDINFDKNNNTNDSYLESDKISRENVNNVFNTEKIINDLKSLDQKEINHSSDSFENISNKRNSLKNQDTDTFLKLNELKNSYKLDSDNYKSSFLAKKEKTLSSENLKINDKFNNSSTEQKIFKTNANAVNDLSPDKKNFSSNKPSQESFSLLETLINPRKTKNLLFLCSDLIIPNFKSDQMLLTVEFASYMLESTPSTPHSSLFKDLKNVEECMSFRIKMIRSELNKLEPNSFPLLVTCFPKLGMYESIFDIEELLYKVTRSLIFPDNAITKHKRFYSFVRNIINRRGRKIEGYIKIMDCNINQEKEINGHENKQSGESYVKEISLLNEGDLNQTRELNSDATKLLKEGEDKQNENTTNFNMNKEEQNEDINRNTINLLTGENLNNIQTQNSKEGVNIFLSKEKEVNKNLIKGINTEVTHDQSQFDNLENVAEKLKDSNEEDKNLYNRQIISTNDLGMESKKIMQDLEENIKVIQNLQINENESIKTGNTYNDNNPFEQLLINDKNVLPGHIRIDSMGQGMGCCCLQLTIQASIMSEARVLYDMLGTVCPLLLRLTRATPISQGKLLSTETRWDMLVFSVDCRTDEERGCAYNISGNIKSDNKDKENKKLIRKSRFSSMDMFISDDKRNLDYYNDLDVPLHEESYKILKGCDVDEKMARHIASLFIRDPILVYNNDENIHNSEDSEKTSREIEEKSNEILNSKKETNKSVLKNKSEKVNYSDETQKSVENVSNDKSEKNHDKKNIKCEKCINENFNECFHVNAGDENVKRIKNENIISDTNKIKVEQMTLNENDKEVLTYKSISSSSYDKNVKEKRKFFTDDFENIQSSNWRSMRFKLPSQNGKLEESGWKVEFRPMEIQPTAFENSAYCIFVVLLSKAIIEYKINFYMPLSLVDENFRRANLLYYKESEFKKKLENDRAIFYYRRNIFEEGKANICEGTIKDIFMGDGDYEGIFGVVKRFVDEHYNKKENCEEEKSNIYKYLNFLEKRINNEYLSVADFMRKFVITHEDYKNDASASEKILDELIDTVKIITEENSVEYLINK